MKRPELTAEKLRSRYSYDPETGIFTSKTTYLRWKAGRAAGCVCEGGNGYKRILINIDKKLYRAHRLAWLYVYGVWPERDIDHIDGNSINNRIANLRLATDSQNLGNMKKPITNRSGKKGVSWHAAGQCWQVHIRVEGKNHYLGHFPTVDEGHAAYCAAAERMRGEFARFE